MATSRICSIPDCGKTSKSRGWCSAHHSRFLRHGDPLAGGTPTGEPWRYFQEVVLPYEGDECLSWPYSTVRRAGKDGKGYAYLSLTKAIWTSCQECCAKEPKGRHQRPNTKRLTVAVMVISPAALKGTSHGKRPKRTQKISCNTAPTSVAREAQTRNSLKQACGQFFH